MLNYRPMMQVQASPSFRPLYEQIKILLTQSLIAGEWRPGESIPSEIELASRFRVSQGTVRKAIDELAADNILVRRQGTGTFVATHAEAHVRLVVAVVAHRLFEIQVREMAVRIVFVEIDIERGLPNREDQTFDQVEDVLLVHERQLDVDLRELRLTIDPQILITKAAHDLKIAIVAGDHEELLEQLWALGQRVEFLGVQP